MKTVSRLLFIGNDGEVVLNRFQKIVFWTGIIAISGTFIWSLFN